MILKLFLPYADFETVEKNAKKLLTKSYRPKKFAKLDFVLILTTNLQKFLENNFFWAHFVPIVFTDLKSA
jgi:hypothetical protein